MMFRDAGNETIPLREIAELGYQYNGWQVVSVRANTRSIDPKRTTVELISNGRVFATQINPGSQISLYPNEMLIIDENTWNVDMRITGLTHIDSISIELRNVRGANIDLDWGYAQYVDIDLNVDAYANSWVNLNEHLDLSIFNGRILERVNLIGALPLQTAPGTVTNVSLVSATDTLGQAQFTTTNPQQVAMWTDFDRYILGQNVRDLGLYIDGPVRLERAVLKIK